MTSTSASTSASTAKKSFFKRPTWATSVPPADSNDFFRHSDTVYDSILREKQRRRRKHAQKKQANLDSEAAEESRENKRRRISTDDEDERHDEKSDSETANTGILNESKTKTETSVNGIESSIMLRPAQASRATPSNAKSSLSRSPQPNSEVINLDADDDQSSPQPKMSERIQPRTSEDEISEEEDEYVLKLKQEAREKARWTTKGPNSSGDQTPVSVPRDTLQRSPSNNQSTSARVHPAPTDKHATIVQILITTKIPNAKPLIVNRKVSQPMQHVREVWCSRQDFDDDMTARVIFTWRGKRLYDTSTSTHLLNVLRRERACRIGGLIDDDEEDPSKGRIEVEAITKDMFEQQCLQKSREEEAGEVNDFTDQSVQDQQPAEGSTTPKEHECKVVMTAQGLEALHLKVRPNTKISKMMAVFKKMRQVDAGKTCWFVFDGDRLEPDSTVGDTDIEDGDAVEVHVR